MPCKHWPEAKFPPEAKAPFQPCLCILSSILAAEASLCASRQFLRPLPAADHRTNNKFHSKHAIRFATKLREPSRWLRRMTHDQKLLLRVSLRPEVTPGLRPEPLLMLHNTHLYEPGKSRWSGAWNIEPLMKEPCAPCTPPLDFVSHDIAPHFGGFRTAPP
ncbi:uncharacterized protein BO80DRAFT_212955 [Aspergillus ibericus CBS 121593]|uniref:Uncharacterized protein n=1 Tax=Aspergillus ibericus CBS 121593 TaxID=1448316 RepID=A0A395GPX1_9EURO|nr:hypothetical protein BO80DRAFT_212955 [Aspergillus ibericus CBS 121593]RAK96988.1 hypothetical protein BO80DRAFT_212955 [Aspergillus ibericus CBS 121593]